MKTLFTSISAIFFFLHLNCQTNPNNNDFKIGMFNSHEVMKYELNGCELPYETPFYNGNRTSVLNVLKEDGFNIVQLYSPNEWSSENFIKSHLKLIQANGLLAEVSLMQYYKPTLNTSGNYLGYGTNIYDNCGIPLSPCESPFSQNSFRKNHNSLISTVFSQMPYKDIIWGYHISEESSFFHYQHNSPSCIGNNYANAANENYFSHLEIPPINLEQAKNHFKTLSASLGAQKHKIVIMEANHAKSVHANTVDHEGQYNPQYYLQLLNDEDSRDVYFEGSYVQFPSSNWTSKKYSDIFNAGPGNNDHYLGIFKSIDYAKSITPQVHKVINIEGDFYNANFYSHFSSSPSISNGNWLWFQTYTSIIHGVQGIWFWALDQSWSIGETNQWTNSSNLSRFSKNYFPANYKNFASNLSKELRYLVNNNILSTNNESVIYTKTDHADLYCIVPPAQLYIPLPTNEHASENYGLRYTIRTNGTDVYMIITNPLNIPVTVTLNFSDVSNSTIQNSSSITYLFETSPYNSSNSNSYKTNRNSNINLAQNTVGSKYNSTINSNRQITISFGPLDVKIIKFNPSTSANNNNGWDMEWSNKNDSDIGGHYVRPDDTFYTGDFDGDDNEELLCVSATTQTGGGWITLLDYVNNQWVWLWSNYGSSSAGNGIYAYRNNFTVGDFDGDGIDELLGNNQVTNGWTTMFKFENGNWIWKWSDYGSASHPMRPYKDKFYAGDFDGDNKSEVFGCDFPNGWMSCFKWNGSDFTWAWSDYGNNHSIRPYTPNMIVGDFDGDNKDELLGLNDWATLFHFDNGNWNWGWSTYGATNLAGWNYPFLATDFALSANFDFDNKNELLMLHGHQSGEWATSMDYNTATNSWSPNWTSNPGQNNSFLDNWSIRPRGGSWTKYIPIRVVENEPERLIAMRHYCHFFDVKMYRPLGDNKSLTFEEDGYTVNENDYLTNQDTNPLIQFFPNPVNNFLHIESPHSSIQIVRVINLTGQILLEIALNEVKFDLDLSRENAGTVIVQVICSNGMLHNEKIQISH